MKDQFIIQMKPTSIRHTETEYGHRIDYYSHIDGVNYVYSKREEDGTSLGEFWKVHCSTEQYRTVIYVHDNQVPSIDVRDLLHVVFHDRYAKAVSKGEADVNIEGAF